LLAILSGIRKTHPVRSTGAANCALFLTFLLLTFPTLAHSATRTSIQNGSWSNPTTWGGSIPTDSDDVVIASGTTVNLDISTAFLRNVTVLGTLDGDADTLFITSSFTGSGTFNVDSGTVFFASSSTETLSTQSFGSYYNLCFSDTSRAYGSRLLQRDLTIEHDFTCDFRNDSLAKIGGTGNLTVGGSFYYTGDSTNWVGSIHLNDQLGLHFVRLHVEPSRWSTGKPFAFPKIFIQKPDTTFIVAFGFPDTITSIYGDSLYVGVDSGHVDTAIDVLSGTLDAGEGLPTCLGSSHSPGTGPFIHLGPGTRFRTGRICTATGSNPEYFDTTIIPYFLCDSGSTFEYYAPPGHSLALEDISFLVNNIIGHAYWNLWISGWTVAGFAYNPVRTQSDFYIQQNGLSNPARTELGPGKTLGYEQITIEGNVLNENLGSPGSTGAGLDGDGMEPGNDTWIFDRAGDTSHWIGPGEVTTVNIGAQTMLFVRFVNDSSCDSILFHDAIHEMGGTCGGHIAGRVLTMQNLFDSASAFSTFGNIGLSIRSGSAPFLGRTMVTRTAGYAPPGAFYGNRAPHAISRYFNVTPANGPQSGLSNHLDFHYDCSEVNDVVLARANFWRSTDNGAFWALIGRDSIIEYANVVSLDTDCVGYPNGSNQFLWAIADQEVDTPLPALLDYFTASRTFAGVSLNWKTFSEPQVLGFEIYRIVDRDTALIRSWRNDPALTSRIIYGATYAFLDSLAPNGQVSYRLEERHTDGTLEDLGAAQVRAMTTLAPTDASRIFVTPNPIMNGQQLLLEVGSLVGLAKVTFFDESGRIRFGSLQDFSLDGSTRLPVNRLLPGTYLVKIQQGNRIEFGKFEIEGN
jgi:hypothetical protein